MRLNNIADPNERTLLAGVLADVSTTFGIEPESAESDAAADLILSLYWSGHRTASDLRAAFDARVGLHAKPDGRLPRSKEAPTGDSP